MKIFAKIVLSLMFLVAAPLSRLLAQNDAESVSPWAITGAWSIVDASYQGRPYYGTVEITTGKDAFDFHWSAGGSAFGGVGLALDGWVGVAWGASGKSGLAIYQIVSDSVLDGSWINTTNDYPIGHEQARGGRLSRKQAVFTVSGNNPNDGSAYTGSLKLTRRGETYDVVWKIGKDTFYGVGIRQGDVLVVGWGSAAKGLGVVAYKFDMEHALGKWALSGDSVLSTENLERHGTNASPGAK